MTALSGAARALSLEAHFGANRHPSALATLYFALYAGDPFGTGQEPANGTGGYGRAAVANDAGLWGTIAAGATSISNASAVVWAAATGAYSVAGPYTYVAVFDSSTGGTLWYSIPLSSSSPITTPAVGDQPRLPVSALTVQALG